jgi:hypothetical protein
VKQLIRLNTGGRLPASTANVRLGIMCFAPRKLPVIENTHATNYNAPFSEMCLLISHGIKTLFCVLILCYIF